MRRFLPALLAAALWTGGCGHVGDPLVPRANVPGKINDLVALQRGATVYAQFSVPPRTTEGILITTPLVFDLRAGPGLAPFDMQKWADQARQFTNATVQNGIARFEFPAAPWIGQDIVLAARSIGANRKEAPWSNLVTVPVVAAPARPQNLDGQATAQGVHLTWTAPPGAFRVYIPEYPGEKGVSRLADAAQSSYTDATAEFGKPYDYLVQRIVKLPGGKEVESDASNNCSITPKDTFPPAAPTGLHASVAPGSIEIAWQQNTEPDLAGYRVYRAIGNGPFERLAEVSQIPTYSDHAVEAGKTYRYAVTAIDQSDNESGRSAAIEVPMQ